MMKCGVIFYFVSLDSLEITHSILKDWIFQLSKMSDLLASGQKNIFPLPRPPSMFLGLLVCFNLQLIIQIHFEMRGNVLSGLFKGKAVFISHSRQVGLAIRLKNRPIVCVDLVAYCDEGLRQTGVFKSVN